MKSKARRATDAVMKALTPSGDGSAQTDLLDTLKDEHDEVKRLLSKLQDAKTAAQRKSLVRQIKLALVPHTKAEEKVLYDAIIRLKDKGAQVDGHEGYLEHEWASKTLQRLDRLLPATSAEHQAAAKVLKELVEHHIREEESNVWDDAREHFSDEQRQQMNLKYLAAKGRVKVP